MIYAIKITIRGHDRHRVWRAKNQYDIYLIHRKDGPAFEWFDGNKSWYEYGHIYRVGEPARIYKNRIS